MTRSAMSLQKSWKVSLALFQKGRLKELMVTVMRACPVSPLRRRSAVKQLKSGRAPGVDMITAELLKRGEKTVVDQASWQHTVHRERAR